MCFWLLWEGGGGVQSIAFSGLSRWSTFATLRRKKGRMDAKAFLKFTQKTLNNEKGNARKIKGKTNKLIQICE